MTPTPWRDDAAQAHVAEIRAHYRQAGREPDDEYPIHGMRTVYDAYVGGLSWEAACRKRLRELDTALGIATVPTGLLPLRIVGGRLQTDAGWIGWYGLSEFDAIHLVRTGQEGELVRRLDRAAACGRNGIRVLAMAHHMFGLSPAQPGYGAALDRVLELAAARGLYTELCLFADAQIVLPDGGDRRLFVREMGAHLRGGAGILPQLANEPFKNGWAGAVDPELLDLAERFADAYGSRGFSIGDPCDVVTDPDTGDPVKTELDRLAQHSEMLVLHGERKGRDERWAGWVDHLKGFDELGIGRGTHYRIHDEPMGAASTFIDGKREDRPQAHLAAALVCAVMGVGHTYHYISKDDDHTPGLDLCRAAALVPASPDFRFSNANTPGAPVTSFTGFDKVRCCSNGAEAWAVGYGHALGAMTWAPGWTPETVVAMTNVALVRARR